MIKIEWVVNSAAVNALRRVFLASGLAAAGQPFVLTVFLASRFALSSSRCQALHSASIRRFRSRQKWRHQL